MSDLTSKHWKKIGTKPRHGICLALSSLHSKKSCGIGEFHDLIPLIDWCKQVGFDVIQLLPLNDSGNDPGPYNALSSCALNPIYLSIPGAPQLPFTQRISYHEVQSLKLNLLRDYYEKIEEKITQDKAFQSFITEHAWVIPYALFKVLKHRLEQNPWMTWPDELKIPNFSELSEKHHREMMFYVFLQFLCHQQLLHVKKHAKSQGVLLKGDIPILISPDSVDCWQQPELFDFSFSAGAPPDPFNAEGQHWGFPLFNWENVKKSGYAWWKVRLAVATQFYDLYRIDHVVGFFRIWAIPSDVPAKDGKFIPENPALWIPQGKEILQMMLESSPMLPIAEDLGVVPPSVRTCLLDLKICGTKVLRWERDYDDHKAFIPFDKYPAISMTTVSTADSETLQLWWQNNPEDAKTFAALFNWKYSPDLTQDQRQKILQTAHHTPSIFHINLLQEYLALFPELVWPSPEDERINIPGKVLPTNWTYRFRTPIEEITSHPKLKESIKNILSG